MSMWTCSNLVETGVKVPGEERVWRVTLKAWRHLDSCDSLGTKSNVESYLDDDDDDDDDDKEEEEEETMYG